ncbi:MAG: DUF977 family protein [Lentisphaerae bacterium]|nr:DUF977 family protein [Lentisphaerota bacterium]
MLFFLVAILLRAFRPEFRLPNELVTVVLQVLGIFFGSKASKYIWEGRQVVADPETVSRQEDQMLELIKEKEQVKNKDVAELLGVSRATAMRLLADMVARGVLRMTGTRKAAVYEAVTDK